MTMDAEELAKVVSALLVPCLPYLIGGAGRAGKAVGEEAWRQAQRLWATLKPKVDEVPSASEAAADAANSPEDADAQAAFRLQLRKLLAQDPALLEALSQVWREIGQPGARAGQRIVTIGGDVSSSAIIAGDSNTLVTGTQETDKVEGQAPQPASQVEALFTPIISAVQTRKPDPHVDREEIEEVVKRLRYEVALGAQANPIRVERWLRSLAETAPDILSVMVSRFLDPALGAPTVIQAVAERYRA